MLTRREMLVTTVAGFIDHPVRALLGRSTPVVTTESQRGDPGLNEETISFDADAIQRLSSPDGGKALFATWDPALPQRMLETARAYKGKSRQTTPDVVREFLEVFDLRGDDIPFCAAAVSYCALRAFANQVQPGHSARSRMDVMRSLAADVEHYYFYPTVSCLSMWHIASGKGRWVSPRTEAGSVVVPKPGWITLFDWDRRGRPDHCGIVNNASEQSLFTMEFNTSLEGASGSQRNGGHVDLRKRSYAAVLGFIRTDADPSRPQPGRIG